MPDAAGVFVRVKRDKRIANLLYVLLGFEDELDPAKAVGDLARIARAELVNAPPEYRVRVAEAAGLLIELCVAVAAGQDPAAVLAAGRDEPVEVRSVRVVELPPADDAATVEADCPCLPGAPEHVHGAGGYAIEDSCDADD